VERRGKRDGPGGKAPSSTTSALLQNRQLRAGEKGRERTREGEKESRPRTLKAGNGGKPSTEGRRESYSCRLTSDDPHPYGQREDEGGPRLRRRNDVTEGETALKEVERQEGSLGQTRTWDSGSRKDRQRETLR